MRQKSGIVLSAVCFLTAGLLFLALARTADTRLAGELAPQVLRFHILANSDRHEDQELKLEVRSLLLDLIYEGLEEDPSQPLTKDRVVSFIREQAIPLAQAAEALIRSRGFSYPVSIRVEDSYFPVKYYGDVRFPEGVYQAARVTIGEGKGHNWWCVLYPKLCFVEESWAVMPEESEKVLSDALPGTDCSVLVKPRPRLSLQWKISDLFRQ